MHLLLANQGDEAPMALLIEEHCDRVTRSTILAAEDGACLLTLQKDVRNVLRIARRREWLQHVELARCATHKVAAEGLGYAGRLAILVCVVNNIDIEHGSRRTGQLAS